MLKNHLNDDGDAPDGKLPVLAGHSLPSTESRNQFYGFQEAEEIQLRDYLDVIMRRKWLILTVLVLVFLSTLIFTLASTKIYKALGRYRGEPGDSPGDKLRRSIGFEGPST